MEKRVIIIRAYSENELERLVNNFLSKSDGKLHDIKIWDGCTVMLIYTPEE